MRPSKPILNSAHGGLSDSVLGGDHLLLASVFLNRGNLRVSKLRKSMPLSRLSRAMQNLVGVVFSWCCPTKITCPAIQSVAIVVGALHPLWAFAKKSLRDKQMNVCATRFTVGMNVDRPVAAPFVDVRSKNSSLHNACSTSSVFAGAAFTANTPQIANRDQPIEPNYGAPFFMNIFHAMNYTTTMHHQQIKFTMKGGY